METKNIRKIRSFVRREGRMTTAQTRALNDLFPVFGLKNENKLFDFESIFGNQNPINLEIGFGMGHSLIEMAMNAPDENFIGIEVHSPGVGTLLNEVEKNELKNIRVIQDDAVEILKSCTGDGTLDRINIYFPDPWHKARHHKRRLIQPEFINLLARKLKSQGKLHLATDWENYAEHMMEVLSASDKFNNAFEQNQYAPDAMDRPETKFERRGVKLGHGVWDMMFVKA